MVGELELTEPAPPAQARQTLREAQAFVERHHITGESDYYALGFRPWAIYERFKIDLGKEVGQADPPVPAEFYVEVWGQVCRRLAEVLRI